MTYEKIFADVKKAYAKADKNTLKGDFAFQFNITGEGEGIFYVAYRGGILEIAPYDYMDRNATLVASGENFIKLAAGRITLEEAVSTGLIEVKGDYNLALELNNLSLTGTDKKEVVKKPKKEETPKAAASKIKKSDIKTAPLPSATTTKSIQAEELIGAQNAVKPVSDKKSLL